jgi:uncharacterized protein (UPF0261 family)
MAVYLLATLDTKGPEADFVRDRLTELGVGVCVMDTGCVGVPSFVGDVPRELVFEASGHSLAEMRERNDRGDAVENAALGARILVQQALVDGKVQGVLAIGGSAGTTIGTAVMRDLPLGIPKVMVSTLASGNVRPYVGEKDIFMLNSVVDIAGLNRISRPVLAEAAAAMAGMVLHALPPSPADRPLIAATMFGVTTPCVLLAQKILERAGYEVVVFHATGNGGQAMESLIRDGLISGVLDITTTELADELVGGILSAGPDRLTAAARHGIPQVVSVGALDMVNFGPRDTVPDHFRDRKFHQHNATVTLMRTTVSENRQLGVQIGQKLATAKGPTAILLPTGGLSAIDRAGQPFDDPDARNALFDAIESHSGPVKCTRHEMHINDPEFAELAANKLIAFIENLRRDASAERTF